MKPIGVLNVWGATAETMACNRTLEEQVATIRTQGNHGAMSVLRGGLLTALGAPKPKESAETCVIFGCYRPFTTPFLVSDTLRLLELLQIDYTYLAKEYCCGAPLIMQADEKNLSNMQATGDEMIARNTASAKDKGASRLAYCCAGCVHAAKNAFPAMTEQHVYINELLMKSIKEKHLQIPARVMGYFSGCRTFFRNVYPAARIDWLGIRHGLEAIDGLSLVDLPEKLCCKVSADKIIDRAIKQGLDAIVCPCNWCHTSLQQITRGRIELVTLPELLLQCVFEH